MTHHFLKLVLLSFLSCFVYAEQVSDSIAPESGHHTNGTPTSKSKQSLATQHIVVTAHKDATNAAFAVLEAGGNAIDAMVTAQTVLGLVEPQSSGFGGGAFLVYFDAKTNQVTTYDGRETAPLASGEDLFLEKDKQPMAFFDAVVGGRSVGTPGTVKLLSDVHKELGNLAWNRLLTPAAELAEQGFFVGPRLANAVKRDEKFLSSDSTTYDYFFPEGQAIQAGQSLKNPDYAKTLRTLAKEGGDYFYNSAISQAIIDKVNQAHNPGRLSKQDFQNYRVIERDAICSPYRVYDVCGMGPPSSGAIAVSQTLGMLESFDMAKRPTNSAITWQLIGDASKLAFADRGLYLADPDFVPQPKGLLDPGYLKQRAKLITPGKALSAPAPGTPDPNFVVKHQAGYSLEVPSTSHFVIVDSAGNIVSMTSTIENGFGSRLMVEGFLLNNELTDFSFKPSKAGVPVANRVQAGKRPRSSMAPTIVFKRDQSERRRPYLAIGSPGGSRIINYVSNSLIAILDWNMPPQEAFDQPHIINRFGTMDIEQGTSAVNMEKEFEALGFETSVRDLNSGLHGVLFTDKGMLGAADKRREGTVKGR